MRRPIVPLMLSLVALDASAASVEDAQRLLDAAAPLHCEVLNLQYQAMGAPAGPKREAMQKEVYRRALEVDEFLAAGMREYESTLESLSPNERATVRTYAMGLMRECAKGASARYGVQLPLPAMPGESATRKVVPYVPPHAKASGAPPEDGSSIEAQTPSQPR